MLDCTTNRYDELYAPWLADPDTLLRLADLQAGERLLDLCGGTGAVSQAAMEYKPSAVTLLDLKPRPGRIVGKNCQFTVVFGRAETMPGRLPRSSFDVVVCRQALGYLSLERALRAVSFVLAPGGRFVFNSFRKPKMLGWKCYSYKGKKYIEAHLFTFDHVTHLQGRLWDGVDMTQFRYYSPQQIRTAAKRYFGDKVEMYPHGRGLHWLCKKGGQYASL